MSKVQIVIMTSEAGQPTHNCDIRKDVSQKVTVRGRTTHFINRCIMLTGEARILLRIIAIFLTFLWLWSVVLLFPLFGAINTSVSPHDGFPSNYRDKRMVNQLDPCSLRNKKDSCYSKGNCVRIVLWQSERRITKPICIQQTQ